MTIDHPETGDFLRGSLVEAAYQRQQWKDTDPAKTDADWFWTLSYIAGKVLWPDLPLDKKLHRVEAAAGMLANWHAALAGEQPNSDPWWRGRCREIAERAHFLDGGYGYKVTAHDVELVLMTAEDIRREGLAE